MIGEVRIGLLGVMDSQPLPRLQVLLVDGQNLAIVLQRLFDLSPFPELVAQSQMGLAETGPGPDVVWIYVQGLLILLGGLR